MKDNLGILGFFVINITESTEYGMPGSDMPVSSLVGEQRR